MTTRSATRGNNRNGGARDLTSVLAAELLGGRRATGNEGSHVVSHGGTAVTTEERTEPQERLTLAQRELLAYERFRRSMFAEVGTAELITGIQTMTEVADDLPEELSRRVGEDALSI